MKTTIWTTYHRDELVEEYGLAEDATHRLFATNHTPEGENVNFLNPCWSELTTMFYVWKNQIKSDVVGFEHYRRRLHVRRTPKRGECQVFTTMRFGHSVAEQYVRCHLREDMDKAVAILNKRFGRDNMYSLYLRHSLTLIPNCCFQHRFYHSAGSLRLSQTGSYENSVHIGQPLQDFRDCRFTQFSLFVRQRKNNCLIQLHRLMA